MPSSTLFVNPVVAQQIMAADQYALQQRAMDLADRNSFLDGIRQSQESARKYDVDKEKNKNTREDNEGKNKIGAYNAETGRTQGNRRLDIDSIIAENDRKYRSDQLATQETIARINAAAGKLRPQDQVTIAATIAKHNSEAQVNNATAVNAAGIIQQLAQQKMKNDEDSLTGAEYGTGLTSLWGWRGNKDDARKSIQGKLKPFDYYYREALKDKPDYSSYVQLKGTNVVPLIQNLYKPEGNGYVEVQPTQDVQPVAPQPPAPQPYNFSPEQSPQYQFNGLPDETLRNFGGQNPAGFIPGIAQPQVFAPVGTNWADMKTPSGLSFRARDISR